MARTKFVGEAKALKGTPPAPKIKIILKILAP